MITGTGVHDRPESAFTIDWNECSRSTGIGVHDPPERASLVQKWLGHAQLSTTAIYADAVGEEEHSIASRMW